MKQLLKNGLFSQNFYNIPKSIINFRGYLGIGELIGCCINENIEFPLNFKIPQKILSYIIQNDNQRKSIKFDDNFETPYLEALMIGKEITEEPKSVL